MNTKEVVATEPAMVIHRIEVLKCLIASLCSNLFVTPDQLFTTKNRMLEYIVCNSSYYSLALFYSLINGITKKNFFIFIFFAKIFNKQKKRLSFMILLVGGFLTIIWFGQIIKKVQSKLVPRVWT